jgi:hypothetical protein
MTEPVVLVVRNGTVRLAHKPTEVQVEVIDFDIDGTKGVKLCRCHGHEQHLHYTWYPST